MKAVILAGGKGTRLGQLTETLPKPMVPINGRPLLEHQVRLLKRYRVEEVILSTGYLSEQIATHFRDGSKFGLQIRYVCEPQPLGTAGALKQLEGVLQEDFLVLYGDVMLDMNLRRLLRFHASKAGAGTLVLHPNDHPEDSDLVELDAETSRVTAFHPKPHPPGMQYRNLVNAGVCVLSPRVFRHIPSGEKTDLGRDIFPRMVEKDALYGYVTAEYLKDMGTPARLQQVTEDVLSGRVKRHNSRHKRKAIFLDRDGVINRHIGLLSKPGEMELLPGVAESIRAINQSDYLAIVVTNQPVIARRLCSIQDLEQIHGRMESLLAREGAKVDAIYYCPHHPDKGYPGEDPRYKVRCDCRKPGIGMITRAAEELNIQLEGSIIVGDSVRDIQCGQRAGLGTIAVMTGERWTKWDCEPDYTFPTFSEAIEFVLRDPFRMCFDRLQEDFQQSRHRRPFVVTIDGRLTPAARNFANYFARSFRALGQTVRQISFDDWLLRQLKDRDPARAGDPAWVEEIARSAPESALLEEVLTIDSRSRKDQASTASPPDVLIIDGAIPPSLRRLREKSKFQVFCEFEAGTVAARLESFLAWRGFEAGDVEAMLAVQREQSLREEDQEVKPANLIIALREERPAHDHHAYALPG